MGWIAHPQHPRLPVHSGRSTGKQSRFPNPLTPASRILAQSGREGSGPGRGSTPWGRGARTGLALAPAEGVRLPARAPRLFPGGGGGMAGKGRAGAGSLLPPRSPPRTLPSTELAAGRQCQPFPSRRRRRSRPGERAPRWPRRSRAEPAASSPGPLRPSHGEAVRCAVPAAP